MTSEKHGQMSNHRLNVNWINHFMITSDDLFGTTIRFIR